MSNLLVPERNLEHAHVLVELFDAVTGRKVDESSGENYITPAGIAHNRWKVRNDYMASMPGSLNQDVEPLNPFGEVYLTDSAETIDTGSSLAEGQVMAWANKTPYVGADTFRGSPNSGECEADPSRAKWVFDWPTTGGNGTLRSVGWRPAGAAPNTRDFAALRWQSAVNTLPNPTYAGGVFRLPDDTYWVLPYMISTGAATGVRYTSINPTSAAEPWGPTGAQIAHPTSGTIGAGGCTDGTTVWICSAASPGTPSPTIRRFNLPTGLGAISGAANMTIPGVSFVSGITYDGSMLWVIDSANQKLVRADKSTGAVDRDFTTLGATYGIGWNATRQTIMSSEAPNRLVEYDISGTVKRVYSGTTQVNTYPQQPFELTDGQVGLPVNWVSGTRYTLLLDPIVGSRILLPSPIVKNSLQTMKLTYTFTYS